MPTPFLTLHFTRSAFTFLLAIGLCLGSAMAGGSRLEILFLGDDGHHQPHARFKQMAAAMGVRGINLTYTADANALNAAGDSKSSEELVFDLSSFRSDSSLCRSRTRPTRLSACVNCWILCSMALIPSASAFWNDMLLSFSMSSVSEVSGFLFWTLLLGSFTESTGCRVI